jgi:uncharacterized protein
VSEFELRAFDFDSELEIRAGGDGRTISGLVAPWDIEITASGPGGQGVIREVLRRGALKQSINRRGTEIPLTFYHPEPQRPFADRNIIGKPIEWADSEAGQRATFRIVKTTKGDEALEMIREGLIKDFSIGFKGVEARTTVTKERGKPALYERYEVTLDHVALVPSGAYPLAEVQEVRAFDPDSEDIAPRLAIARRKLQTII